MIKTTRAQREALFNVFRRSFPGWVSPSKRVGNPELYKSDAFPYKYDELQTFAERHPEIIVKVPTIQYRRFLKTCQPEFCGYGAVMVPYAGMWLGIEKDGYTHS